MGLITRDDFIETQSKLSQRGWDFIASKFNFNAKARTKSAFNESLYRSSNWWTIPKVKERWNFKITGDTKINYERYLVENILAGRKNLSLLSIGCGVASHEIELARYELFDQIIGVDLVAHLLKTAEKEAENLGLKNIQFKEGDITEMSFDEPFDLILFHASLHHFYDIENLISQHVIPRLSSQGLLVINEYVGANRLQYPKVQKNAINQMLQLIPKKYRTRFRGNRVKNSYSGPGLLRMIIADPSECVDSDQILPVLRNQLKPILERPYGGNLLMGGLKDIAHHFVEEDKGKLNILERLFDFEDNYLENHESDFIFGVYQKEN